jgi:hypothetical protein
VTHAAVVYRDTPGDRMVYGSGDTRRLSFSFMAIHVKTGVGVTPPATAAEAITLAETNGANLRIDGQYVGPTGTSAMPSAFLVLSGLTVTRLDNTNEESDVIWLFQVELEYAGRGSLAEPFVEVATSSAPVTVSAFRIFPVIPDDMLEENPENPGGDPITDDYYTTSNDEAFHSVSDIGGKLVDWNGNPIQYTLPVTTTTITVQRAAPIWLDGGTRDTGAIDLVAADGQYIGFRNSTDMGYIGDVGEVLLSAVNSAPMNNGLYRVSYVFKKHPWKHAIQVPRVIGSTFAPVVNEFNAERKQNDYIWWSQPYLAGADFLCDLGITAAEWYACGISRTCE